MSKASGHDQIEAEVITMDSVAFTMRVSGLVQGVGFRWSTKMVADELGVRGDVANQADGSVVIHALATPPVMAKFKKAIKDSPTPYGRVSMKRHPFNHFLHMTVSTLSLESTQGIKYSGKRLSRRELMCK